ncbi:thymidine phosphorylase [Rhizobiales bacterium GAS191]|jgi:thymidine phosphorylase|nr:thymidine phosphorylase [Rhizobiales bacterium GAS191]
MSDAPFLPQEFIRAKRDGAHLAAADISRFIEGLVHGKVSEGQAAAFAMAVFFKGLELDERVALTRAMMQSGEVLRWELPGPALDKHSTGGVGDNVSLILAPAVAACGGYVPMISGRGLGHTGGTLDKLEAIPGYRAQPDLGLFRRALRAAGCAIIGQTADLAPADKRLYAIRDVTATVESIDLITASILSKKLAAGLDGLVLDVKWGSGAFMAGLDQARDLAHSLVAVANGAGLATTALLTDMNEPLADSAGNALETHHAIAHLTGERRQPRLQAIVEALGAEMLVTGKLAPDLETGKRSIAKAIASGAAAERFGKMVAELGGPADLMQRPAAHLASAPFRHEVTPGRRGFVTAIDTRALGLAVIGLGGGRTRPQDLIDPAVGLTQLAGIGADLSPNTPLAVVHARDEAGAIAAAATLRAAYTIGDIAPPGSAGIVTSRLERSA